MALKDGVFGGGFEMVFFLGERLRWVRSLWRTVILFFSYLFFHHNCITSFFDQSLSSPSCWKSCVVKSIYALIWNRQTQSKKINLGPSGYQILIIVTTILFGNPCILPNFKRKWENDIIMIKGSADWPSQTYKRINDVDEHMALMSRETYLRGWGRIWRSL